MFNKLRTAIKERRLDREMLEFDSATNNVHGKWIGGKRVYDNGCYCVPTRKIGNDEWRVDLYSKNGKVLGEYGMSEIFNWHHGFIMVKYRYSDFKCFYDCGGNAIFDAVGVFISIPVEFGPDLYLIPVEEKCDKYVLYNHRTRKFVSDSGFDGHYIIFDGVKPQDDVIIATVEDLVDVEGYGTLNDSTYYRLTYTIDRSGKIIDFKKEITKTTHGE